MIMSQCLRKLSNTPSHSSKSNKTTVRIARLHSQTHARRRTKCLANSPSPIPSISLVSPLAGLVNPHTRSRNLKCLSCTTNRWSHCRTGRKRPTGRKAIQRCRSQQVEAAGGGAGTEAVAGHCQLPSRAAAEVEQGRSWPTWKARDH